MSLLNQFMSILALWKTAFCKEEAFLRAREHAIAALCAFGRRTITNYAILFGRDQAVPTADYKLYTYCKWKVEDLFNPTLQISLDYFKDSDYITLAADDTKLHKTGKKIPLTSWQRDPMSPPFHTNFMWGLRFLQYSVLIPLYNQGNTPCRSVPIRFVDAPPLKRPGKKKHRRRDSKTQEDEKDSQSFQYVYKWTKGSKNDIRQYGSHG